MIITNINVEISFSAFIDYPPYMAMYLTALTLLEYGIPVEISLTDILKSPKLTSGTLTTVEDFENKVITYKWMRDETK